MAPARVGVREGREQDGLYLAKDGCLPLLHHCDGCTEWLTGSPVGHFVFIINILF